MTQKQLTRLRQDLLRLYEDYAQYMRPDEQQAVTTIREFIYEQTDNDVCTWCGKPIELEGTGLWEDPELQGADNRRYCIDSPNYRHAT